MMDLESPASLEQKPRRVFVEIGGGRNPVPLFGTKEFRENDIYLDLDARHEDLRDKHIEFGEKKYLRDKKVKFFFIEANAENMPIQSNSVDEVCFGNILGEERINHQSIDKFLTEANRILKVGGEIIVLETSTPPHYTTIRNMVSAKGFELERKLDRSDSDFEEFRKRYQGPIDIGAINSHIMIFRKTRN